MVPTPIGNLGDVTLRAIEALEGADAVFSEDTRVTGRLLSALGLKTAKPKRLDENTLESRVGEIVRLVSSGATVAYCTDAGMPGVSDPGLRLVAALRDKGLPVEVLPGPSAAACAYVASGTVNPRYYFGGFLPRKSGDREQLLSNLKGLDAALVFYESPNRLASSLSSIASAFPRRDVAVCRELTKLHEEVFRGPAADVAKEFAQRCEEGRVRGEAAIVVDGPDRCEDAGAEGDVVAHALEVARSLFAEGSSPKSVAKELASELGIPRNKAYEIALEAKDR